MCGRFTIISEKETIEARFRTKFAIPYKPRYNAAPSQPLPIITEDDPKHIVAGHWGYPIHLGEKEKEIINVRAESLEEKRIFRSAFESRRCLVVADGFYEWKRGAHGSVPYRITLQAGGPFAMAGIYQFDEKAKMPGFAIITTTPNLLMRKIHDRMPVILPMGGESLWLKKAASTRELLSLAKPYPYREMAARAISTMVNNPRIDSPALLGRHENDETAA